MNPIPPGVLVPAAPLLLNGHGKLILLVVILALLVLYGLLVHIPASLTRSRERIRCPVQLRPAGVVFELGPDGAIDVVRCSLSRRRGFFSGRRPIICGKACLRSTARV